jgi:hypothetical protein
MDQPMHGQLRLPNPLEDLAESEKEYLSDLKILLQVLKMFFSFLWSKKEKLYLCSKKRRSQEKNKLGAHTTASFPLLPPTFVSRHKIACISRMDAG